MSSSLSTPYSRLIKGLILAGVIFVGFIVISASQRPTTGTLTLQEAAENLSGFRLSAPQTLRPKFLETAGQDLVAIFYWPPGCAARCEKDAELFINLMKENGRFAPSIAKTLNPAATESWRETLPEGVTGLSFRAGETGNLLSESAESLVIFYTQDYEIGRGRGVDWKRTEARKLIRALEATHVRDL